jgi:hypothetical protein
VAEDGQKGGVDITDGMIARRAFELSLTDADATPEEIWRRAEKELREEAERDQR